MFANVLVGVDEHEGGRDALALARHLVGPGGTITLGHVYADELPGWRAPSPADRSAARDRSLRILADAAGDTGADAALRAHGSPYVGRGLHELAEEIGADLLVVGSSRRGLIGRVCLGDDTRSALNGAPCAVAIAPAGYVQDRGPLREIGVGYNGTPESEHALKVARVLAAAHHAKVSAFEAVAMPAFALGAGVLVDEVIESIVEVARKQVAALEDVEPHAVYGHAAEELALFSASVDLLVVGSRSYGPVGRLIHGSTAAQLARLSRCPLLVLTRAARAADTVANGSERDALTGAGTN